MKVKYLCQIGISGGEGRDAKTPTTPLCGLADSQVVFISQGVFRAGGRRERLRHRLGGWREKRGERSTEKETKKSSSATTPPSASLEEKAGCLQLGQKAGRGERDEEEKLWRTRTGPVQ